MNENLKKALLSLLWTGSAAALVAFLTVAIEVLPDLGLPEFGMVMVTLVINQITKYLNKTYKLGARVLGTDK